MSDETNSKPKAAAAASTKAAAGRTSPRGAPAKARVPATPAVHAAPAVAPAPAAPSPKPARRAAAPKTTALKSAALKAAAAPRPEPVASEAAEIAAPADPAPAPAAARAPADIPAPSLAPRDLASAPSAAVVDEIPDLRDEAFSAVGIAPIPGAEELVKPYGRLLESGADGARTAYAQVRESNETLAQACFESAAAASRGMVSLNAQMLDMMRANADLTLGLMRSTLTAGSLSEAVKLQTSGARQAYETTSIHLRAIADTATKLVGEATGPITQAMGKR